MADYHRNQAAQLLASQRPDLTHPARAMEMIRREFGTKQYLSDDEFRALLNKPHDPHALSEANRQRRQQTDEQLQDFDKEKGNKASQDDPQSGNGSGESGRSGREGTDMGS